MGYRSNVGENDYALLFVTSLNLERRSKVLQKLHVHAHDSDL